MAFTEQGLKDPQGEVDRVLARFAQKGISTSTKPVLQINLDRQMLARNNGYPKHMYHAILTPQIVLNDEQEQGIRELGYTEVYVFRSWPAFVFRRNMDPKFKDDDFVEARQVENQAGLERLRKERKSETAVGDWLPEIVDLVPIAEKAKEDPLVTIARLQGQLTELTRGRDDDPAEQPTQSKGGKKVA